MNDVGCTYAGGASTNMMRLVLQHILQIYGSQNRRGLTSSLLVLIAAEPQLLSPN
jgi:hypothetical protein